MKSGCVTSKNKGNKQTESKEKKQNKESKDPRIVDIILELTIGGGSTRGKTRCFLATFTLLFAR